MSIIDKNRIRKAVTEILNAIGEDVEREGLIETPDRVADMYEEVFAGLDCDPFDFMKTFYQEYDSEMILVKDIPLYSICEHHLLPFIGLAHVVYIPRDGYVLGLSKVVRLVDILSRKLQIQERLCNEIANNLVKAVNPIGVAVVIEAEHLCITMRGIKRPGAKTVTSALRGSIKTDVKARAEALALVNRNALEKVLQ